MLLTFAEGFEGCRNNRPISQSGKLDNGASVSHPPGLDSLDTRDGHCAVWDRSEKDQDTTSGECCVLGS